MSKALLDKIIKIILSHKKTKKILLFGSRAKETNNGTSDIDLAILDKNWSDKDINIVKHYLEEYVKTPLKFDVVNYYNVSKKKLQENILKEGKVIYEFGKN
jgi:predicted nucleotidyltransferase